MCLLSSHVRRPLEATIPTPPRPPLLQQLEYIIMQLRQASSKQGTLNINAPTKQIMFPRNYRNEYFLLMRVTLVSSFKENVGKSSASGIIPANLIDSLALPRLPTGFGLPQSVSHAHLPTKAPQLPGDALGERPSD